VNGSGLVFNPPRSTAPFLSAKLFSAPFCTAVPRHAPVPALRCDITLSISELAPCWKKKKNKFPALKIWLSDICKPGFRGWKMAGLTAGFRVQENPGLKL